MTKKKIMTEEPVQHFGFRKLSVGLVSALVSSTMVTNAVNAHAETTTNVEKTATDESDATSSSKTVTAESGIVVDKASDKAEGDVSTSEESATMPDSTKDTEKAKDDQSGTASANNESASTTESTATTNTATDSAAEAESKVAGDAVAASKESSTESNRQATTLEAKSDTSSSLEDQTSSQSSSKDNSATNSSAIDTSAASSLTTSFALPLSTKEKMEAAVNKLINDAPTNTQSSVSSNLIKLSAEDKKVIEQIKSTSTGLGKLGNFVGKVGSNVYVFRSLTSPPNVNSIIYTKIAYDPATNSFGTASIEFEYLYNTGPENGATFIGQNGTWFEFKKGNTIYRSPVNNADYSEYEGIPDTDKYGWAQGTPSPLYATTATSVVNRTIIYKMSDGTTAPSPSTETLTFEAGRLPYSEADSMHIFDVPLPGSSDVHAGSLVTTFKPWHWSENQDFTDVTVPNIDGYTPDRTVISNKNIAHDSADITEVVTYTPNTKPITTQEYKFSYYDVVNDKIVASKTVKYGDNTDFPVPDGYTLAAPGQKPEHTDFVRGDGMGFNNVFTVYPGIVVPKKIDESNKSSLDALTKTGDTIVIPVYKSEELVITRTINLHKPDGTIEVTKQPVVYKTSVTSEPEKRVDEGNTILARSFMLLMPTTDKVYHFDTNLGLVDTSKWSASDFEEYESTVPAVDAGVDAPKASALKAYSLYTSYKVTVSAAKADGTDTWEAYTTPTIAGYKATLDYVDPVKVKVTDSDVTVDIYYTTDTQNATVTYIDDNTGKELTSDALKGNSGAKSGYTTADKIKTYQDLGYVLVSDDTNGQEIVYDNDSSTDQKYTVHLKHGTVLINPENPGHPGEAINPGNSSSVWPDKTDKDSLTATVNRTINYKMSDGSKAPDSVHDNLSYTANTLVDKVTGEILSTEWSPAQDFKDVTSPEVAHYVPDRTVVSNKGIAHDHADIVEEVIYTPKNEAQKAKVTYVDETTGKTLKVDDLNGTSNAKSGYTTAKSIEDYQNLGYVLVSDETSGQEVVFDDDTSKDQEYKVVLKHGYATVTGDNPGHPGEAINPDPNGAKWPDGTDKNSLSEDVHRVITYRMSDSSKVPDQVENVLHFTAKKVVDKVTGEVVSTEWSAPQDFEDVASPAVKGYVADKAVVSNKDIAHDHSDIHEIVTYTPAEQKATVTYVDSLTGKTIMTKELVGKSNAASGYKTEADIKSLVDKGYVFESDETNGQEVVFDDDASVDQNYVVKLTHKFEESEETHQATRKIRLHEPDDLKVITQIGTVKRSVKIDSVTGGKTYGDWTQDKWAEFDTPALDGYTASLDKVEEKVVGGDTKDEVVDIYYNKPEEPAPAPQEPEKPADPVPAEPTPEEPKKPAKPAPEKKEAPAPAKPKAKMKTTVVTTTQAQLPQTGNKDDKVVKASGVLALGASLMATLFSSFKKKSK